MPIPAVGEPAPSFRVMLSEGRLLLPDHLAGRFTTLCFFGSAGVPQMAEMAREIAGNAEIFDGLDHQFVGITIDPDDAARELVSQPPAVRWVWDFDQAMSRQFGVAPKPGEITAEDGAADGGVPFQPLTLLLDPNLRVLAAHKIADPASHPAALAQFLHSLPTLGPPRPAGVQAPVLMVPMVFETEFCRRLIQEFEQNGGHPPGILEDFGGKTQLTFDTDRKRRQDMILTDPALQQAAHARIARRLTPEVQKAFQLQVTRLERSVVARYGEGDFIAPHRDNAALGTAHRQFAVTIPLNADEFSGGHVRFPEFGPQLYQIPTGCAMVHSCGLLHEVLPVRDGARYSFIPVLYGEAAAQLREKNKEFLGEGVTPDRREIRPE